MTRASPSALLALLLEPAAYCRAVPALVRCEPTKNGNRGADPRTAHDVAWELEIPLSNLAGRMEVAAHADWMGLTFRFVEGDLAPGSLHFRWQASAETTRGPRTLLWASLQANVKDANWLLRRLARRDAWTEPAIRAAIVWIAAQAVAAAAENPGAPVAPRPQGPMERPRTPLAAATSPPLDEENRTSAPTPHGPASSSVDLAAIIGNAPASVWAAVERGPTGRLARVRLAGRWQLPAVEALRRVASVRVLGAFTGWSHVTTTLSARDHAEIAVEDAIPFVDFTGRWRLDFGTALEARALSGATEGAQWAFSASSAQGTAEPRASAVVFDSYPRLDRAGWAPRRFIEAEPLLEHGLALALGYVDLMAAERAALSDTPPR